MFYVGKSAKTGKVFILWNFLFGSIFLQRPPPQAQPSSGLRRRTLTTWWGGSSISYLIFSTWWPSHSSIWYLKILTTWLPSLLPHIWSFLFDFWEKIFESKYLRAAQIRNEIFFSSPSLLSPARAWGLESDVGSLQLDHEIGNIVFVVFLIVFLTGIPSIWPSSSLHFNHELGIVILISHCAIFIKTFQQDAKVDISLWGYRETSIEPELVSSQSLFFLILGIIFQRGIDVSIICGIFLNLS